MTAPQPDHYAILGVSPDATQAEISRAYRMLMRRHHPDTRASNHRPGDQAREAPSDAALQQILAAYAVLHHPARRAGYDQHARPPQPAGRPTPNETSSGLWVGVRPPIVAGPVRWHRI